MQTCVASPRDRYAILGEGEPASPLLVTVGGQFNVPANAIAVTSRHRD